MFFKYFEKFNELCDGTNIVSVGSGRGLVEKYLENKYNVDIICVDPEPESWQRLDDLRAPEYSTHEDLLKDRQNIKENCALFLNWPSPNDNNGRYDIHSINDLHPNIIFLVIETSGGAGSDALLYWLENYVMEYETFSFENDFYWASGLNKDKEEDAKVIEMEEGLPKYKVLESSYSIVQGAGTEIHRYIILAKNDLPSVREYKRTFDINLGKVEQLNEERCIIQ